MPFALGSTGRAANLTFLEGKAYAPDQYVPLDRGPVGCQITATPVLGRLEASQRVGVI